MLERLGELKGDINRKRSAVREPVNDDDDLGRALAELHQKYIDLMRDLDRERRRQVCSSLIVLLSVNIGKSESYLTLGNITGRNSLSKVRPLFLK